MKTMIDDIPERGDFSFVHDNHERTMLQDAYNSVNSVSEGWLAMIPDPRSGGFMYNLPPRGSIREQIDIALGATETGGLHSGSSYGWVMRQMQGIATMGWSQYVSIRRNTQTAPTNVLASRIPIQSFIGMYSADSETMCRICFDPLKEVKDVAVLCSDADPDTTKNALCGHTYHSECINKWVNCRHNTCPICRATIVTIHPLLV
jgi:hypothetical protein